MDIVCEYNENDTKEKSIADIVLPDEKQYSGKISLNCKKCENNLLASFDSFRNDKNNHVYNDYSDENCTIVSIEETKTVIENWIN